MSGAAIERIDESLSGLTDFQRATVIAACRHFEGEDGLHGRLLVGDEVGLGKTLVARGVVATLLRHRLARGADERPFRVVYICSNLALARENANKLAVFRGEDAEQWVSTPSFGRLAELGLQQPPAKDGVLMELCSLTPATSLSLTQGGGNARERYIIWRAVLETPYVKETEALESFFRKGVKQSWTEAKEFFDKHHGLEQTARTAFSKRLGEKPLFDSKALEAARELGLSLCSWRTLLRDISELSENNVDYPAHLVSRIRGRVREMFVESCAQNLKADIFILDEFQRFRDLINMPAEEAAAGAEEEFSEQQLIARRVLHEGRNYATLLLSATPFKALTHIGEEEEGKAHAQELTELLSYLCESDTSTLEHYKAKREALLAEILALPEGPLPANSLRSEAKLAVEGVLRKYVCRTERAGIEPGIERVFCNLETQRRTPCKEEVHEFVALDQLAEALKKATEGSAGIDVMMLHKAAPWCLSFLGGYQLRESLRKHREIPGVAAALKNSSAAWIPFEKFQHYQIDLGREAPSTRFKQVLEAALPAGAEKLLWVPPSMPNYQGDGPFAGQDGFSKTLLFSSLVLAPRALSSYISYECERRLLPKRGKRPDYFTNREEHSRTFRFEAKSLSPVWSLVYPSVTLSALQVDGPALALKQLREQIRKELSGHFKTLLSRFGKGKARGGGGGWYTLAPILLDWISANSKAHVEKWADEMTWTSSSAETRKSQVDKILDMLRRDEFELGAPPADLEHYLVDLAIAGPGVCMFRSLNSAWQYPKDSKGKHVSLLACATDAALSFVDKMNRIESQRVLRAVCRDDKPWIAVARYSAMGNLQAVFDEYLHLLKSIHGTLPESISAFQLAVGTGAVSITAQKKLPPPKRLNEYDVRFHCHYAVPLGNQKGTDEKGISRITNARAAFNSPFWPFMLNSTSIGQEGLDFHWYCRRIVHWSLPPNPIDLEQREGRINRFKSLVVRQRIAQSHGKRLGQPRPADVWSALFKLAKSDGGHTDLVPFWHSPSGSSQIERVVPAMPFSQEVSRLDEILRILSLYRLSFGQPRQQELVENLLKRNYSEEDLAEIRRALLIDLAPVNYDGLLMQQT